MKPGGTRIVMALNGVVTLALVALAVTRLTPGARQWVASIVPAQAGASTIAITGPGTTSATIAGYILGDVATPASIPCLPARVSRTSSPQRVARCRTPTWRA